MRRKSDTPDLKAAQIAARQHGVATIAQLRAAGLSEAAVIRRVVAGRYHRVHQGVYAVGHPGLSLEGRWMAAVLACGEGAVLSHGSAAALWGLLRPIKGRIHVSVPTSAGRRTRSGIHLHRCPSLAMAQAGGRRSDISPLVTVHDRIPVTTPARTVADLDGTLPPYLVRRARRQAELAGYALAPGTRSDRSRSDLESDFLEFCRVQRLALPEVNVRIGRWTVDFLWRAELIAVETDSYRYHRGSVAFEDDHVRDLDLRARGIEVHRFTERQIRAEPERVAADLRAALELRRCPPLPSSS